MKKLMITLGLAAGIVACSSGGAGGSGQDSSNPLIVGSSLEFGAPEFDKIKPEHFLPAFKAGMEQQNAQIDSIINQTEAPTFENTIVALERTGEILRRTSNVFFGLAGADGTDEIRAIQSEVAPQLTAHNDAIMLNEKLFERIRTVYNNERDQLTGEDARLIKVLYDDFVRQGAELSAENKTRLKEINSKLSVLTNEFKDKVQDATAAAAIFVEDSTELRGLPAFMLAQAQDDAKKAGHASGYLLTQSNTTRSPYLPYLDNRALRQRLLEASLQRADQGNDKDTNALVLEITRLRSEKAQLLGKANYSEWELASQMAGTPERVYSFLSQIAKAWRPKLKADADELEAFARKTEGNDFKLEAWDWDYYAEKLRKEKYDLDENDIKPYMALDSVLKNGVFFMAKELYGVSFVERTDLPVYAEGVHVYDVIDPDGTKIALFYTDYYRRPTKRGGAWMSSWVKQSGLLGDKPVIYNVCNYPPPVNGEPTLLDMDQVTTLFHEFGHGVHGLFSDLKYNKLSGTSVTRDFVEMPSQFHEHWATDPSVFANYAKHYKTNEPMPTALVEKMHKAAKFNQAYALGESLASVIIDLAWHTKDASNDAGNVKDFEAKALSDFGILDGRVPPRYRSPYFLHSIGGGYASGYYAYLWAEVLDNNVYDWFVENGGLTRENGQKFRDVVLSKGNSKPLDDIFKEMTGLESPNVKSLMRSRGLD